MFLFPKVFQWLAITTVLGGAFRRSEAVKVDKELKTGLDVDLLESESYQNLLPSLKSCGQGLMRNQRVKRVVGGRPVPKRKYPWLAQLYITNVTAKNNIFNCGGTFITERVVLTAGHCLTRISPGLSFLTIGFGHSERMDIKFCPWNAGPECNRRFTRLVEKVIIHKGYSEGNLQNDIGLAILKYPVKFNAAIQPVCLPYSEEMLKNFSSPRLRVSGWGFTNKFDMKGSRKTSEVAMEADIYIAERKYCDKFHTRQYGSLGGNRFCALGEAGKGSCNGDSGGPLMKNLPVSSLNGTKRTFQLGMVSSGDPGSCGYQGRPMIYVNILYYMPWILQKLAIVADEDSMNSSEEADESTLNLPGSSSMEDMGNSSDSNYTFELSTGLDINVLSHPNIIKLPKSEHCGSIPTPKSPVQPVPKSEEDVMYDEYEDNRVKRIAGGRIAGISWFPFMAQVYSRDTITGKGDLRCGGMIISNKVILTAASCVTNLPPPQALDYIQVGNFNRNLSRECTATECFDAQIMSISEIVVHEGFTKYAYENDIALIKLGREISFGVATQPVCLPLYESLLDNLHLRKDTKYLSAGWGSLSQPSETEIEGERPKSNLPQHIDVRLRPRKDCSNVFSRFLGELDRSRFCGGGESGKGECTGDAGGPLMKPFLVKHNNTTIRKYLQFGVTSFYECGTQGLPTIYTNILYHMPWVLDHL